MERYLEQQPEKTWVVSRKSKKIRANANQEKRVIIKEVW